MKAIEQIIAYLHGRGALSPEQLQYLERHGLWERNKDASEEEPPRPYFPTGEPLDPEVWEIDLEERLLRERPGKGRGKKQEVARKGPVLEPAEVEARLRAAFPGWMPALAGLMQLGRRLAACPDWEAAAVAVRNADAEALADAVREGLRNRAPSLKALWDAVCLEDYRHVLAEPGLHGPAVAAYRVLLAIPDYVQLGKYAWVLKIDAVRHVFNLRQAQRQLLRAGERLLHEHPDLIGAALHRDHHPQAYWTFVALYSARGGRTAGPASPGQEPHFPARRRPDEKAWLQVWAHAAMMEPVRVLPLLLRCRQALAGGQPPEEAWKGVLMCPKSWDG
ncbi:MAG TPA: hypothetical protein VJ739_07850 [Gemmataceae bacterium]|nr:hypothetical protein [Gemmataceae bacterium]